MRNKKWLYVFTRKDLTPSQIAVQSIHSAFEMGRHFANDEEHPSVVLIKLKNENELKKVKLFLSDRNLCFKEFIEPYYKNTITSICVEPITQDFREVFKKFQLMRDKDFRGVSL
jgi:hypothetical protein